MKNTRNARNTTEHEGTRGNTKKAPVQWTGAFFHERTTRFELATSTLARLRSTN